MLCKWFVCHSFFHSLGWQYLPAHVYVRVCMCLQCKCVLCMCMCLWVRVSVSVCDSDGESIASIMHRAKVFRLLFPLHTLQISLRRVIGIFPLSFLKKNKKKLKIKEYFLFPWTRIVLTNNVIKHQSCKP